MEAVLSLPCSYTYSGGKVDEYKICVYRKHWFNWLASILNPSYIIKHRRTFCGIPLWWHKIYFLRIITTGKLTKKDTTFMVYFKIEAALDELNKLELGYPPISKIVYKNGEMQYIQRRKRKWNDIFNC